MLLMCLLRDATAATTATDAPGASLSEARRLLVELTPPSRKKSARTARWLADFLLASSWLPLPSRQWACSIAAISRTPPSLPCCRSGLEPPPTATAQATVQARQGKAKQRNAVHTFFSWVRRLPNSTRPSLCTSRPRPIH
jgi:hypothetical protein